MIKFRLRNINISAKFSNEVNIQAFNKFVSPTLIDKVLEKTGKREIRLRKLGAAFVVWFCIALNLFTDESYKDVQSKLAKGLRYIWPDSNIKLPGKSALCKARQRLGVSPMVELYRETAHPLAGSSVSGAFLFGLRVVAIDGTTEDLPDTPENAAYFGRHSGSRGDSAFPQAEIVYLCECGTHAILDAGIWPIHTSERIGGHRLLRSVDSNMLVTLDCGFASYDMVDDVVNEHAAQLLARVPSHWKLKPVEHLDDDSYTAYIYPSDYRRKKAGERMLVRVIEYTLSDPNRPGYGIVHRLITSLMDPDEAPAMDLVCAYHERWEIEIAIDEIDTHQREVAEPFRSRTPLGIIQEFYSLLVAYNAVCSVRLQVAQYADVDPDRISFVVTLRKLCEAVDQFQQTSIRQLPTLFERLLRDIAEEKLPARRNRSNPRVVKRKMSNFMLKRDKHRNWPQPTAEFRDAIELLK